MLNLITMRTEELVTLASAKESTAEMQLTGKSRVHISKAKSLPLCPILHGRCHQVKKPTVQLPASSLTDVFLLGLGLEVQVLEDQDGVRWNPLTELSSSFLTERPVAIMMFPGQPFQHPTNTPRVPVLCLLPGKFGLKSGTNFARFGVANGQSLATNEKCLLVGGSDQSVIDTEVNAYGCDSPGLGSLDGDAEESLSAGNPETVDALGGIEVLAEVVGNFPANFLATLKSRDGQTAISAEREVLGKQEKCCRASERERASRRPAVGLGPSIGCRSCSDGVASHLRSQGGRSLVIDCVMQLKSAKGFATVETDWADGLLVTVELRHGLINERILVKDYRYGSLDVHAGSIVLHLLKSNTYLEIKEAGNSSVS
jgi:hypothetical protein